MPPMENSCHVFLQKHSVPKDLGNNYAVKKKKLNTDVRYSTKFNALFTEALESHSIFVLTSLTILKNMLYSLSPTPN